MTAKYSAIDHRIKPAHRWAVILAVVILLLGAALLLIWRTMTVQAELAEQHEKLLAEVVSGAGQAIAAQLRELQRGVTLLAEDNEALIRELAANPDDMDLYNRLNGRIERVFPEAFSFTLANAQGEPLLEDLEGLVGEVCREEISHFSQHSRSPEPQVHPNPLGYHFDTMHPILLREGVDGIFFVSFGAEILASILAKHGLPGHALFLENRAVPGLIEVAEEGARDALQREIWLSPEEQNRIIYRYPLDETHWDVIAVQSRAAATSPGWRLWQQTGWALGVLGIIGIATLIVIRRSQLSVESSALSLEKQQRCLRAIVETVAEAIITIDQRGVIQTFNPAALRTFGYRASEVIGQNVRMLMPEPYHSEHDGYLAHYLSTGERRIIGKGLEVTGRRKDGSSFPMELAVNDSLVGGQHLFTAAIRDITERKQIDQMKNEFISIVSHELRTPLTSIRGSLGLIAGGAIGEIPPQAKQLIDIASNNSERLVRLINDILDIEKIESGKMQFEMKPQRLLPLVEQAIESSHGLAVQHGVGIELESDPADLSAKLDAERITQVLLNLLSNAVKFSPHEAKVRVSINRTENGVRVAVSDSGRGIPEEFRGRVFEKFAQADASDGRQKGGSGLGLSICKAIIQEHGGEIGFDSQPGEGSTFYIELPQVEELTQVITLPLGQFPRHRGARLLVCEDDADVATLIRLMLEQDGYQVDIAQDVPQARQMIAETSYDAVTMDLALPGEDGLSFIRELQQKDATRDLPIVVLSAKAEQGKDELRGTAVGVVDWLNKPIDQSCLLSVLRRATGEMTPNILYVEDDDDLAMVISGILGNECHISHAKSLRDAEHWLGQERFDLIILDLGLPDGSGLSLLPIINGIDNPPPILVFSAHELSPEVADGVSSALIKSRTDNFTLLRTVNTLLDSVGRGGKRARGNKL